MTDIRVTILRTSLGLAAACALALGLVASADEPAATPTPTAEQAAQEAAPAPAPAPALDGMKAYVDAQGRLRPPTETELRERSRGALTAFDAATRLQVPLKSADGTLSLVLDTSYLHASVAHVGEDGKVHWNCTEHGTEPVAPAAAEEK